jgi:arylsulfatase A-like enzyme
LFCLVFYWLYTQEYKVEENSAFVTELNKNSFKSRPRVLGKEGMVNNRNIILIVIDTLRADHLSCYGYERLTSPNIDDFAKRGVLFTNAIVQKTKTSPSVASILTGTYPYTHGVDGCRTMLYDDAITIGEVVKEHDYRTASVVSNGNLGYEFNFTQGFDDVFEVWKLGSTIAENVNKYAISWLEKNYQDKFFLYIHYIDPHSKYTPPPPYNEMFVNDEFYGRLKDIKIGIGNTHWNSIHYKDTLLEGPHQTELDYYISQYDGEIRYCDEYVGQLLNKIKELGLDKNTLIILTADHGEDLTEHDFYFGHGTFAYEACARVPFIISFPPIFKPKLVDDVVETVDIFPTILDFLGMEKINNSQGNSLFPILSGEDVKDINLKKFGFVEGNYGKQIVTAIRTKDWKLIYNPYLLHIKGETLRFALVDTLDFDSIYFPSFIWKSWSYFCAIGVDDLRNYNMRYELYNIKEDPDEQNNLYLKRSDIAITLRKELMKWLKEHPRRFVKDITNGIEGKKPEKETLENLKALGYIQ